MDTVRYLKRGCAAFHKGNPVRSNLHLSDRSCTGREPAPMTMRNDLSRNGQADAADAQPVSILNPEIAAERAKAEEEQSAAEDVAQDGGLSADDAVASAQNQLTGHPEVREDS